MSSTLPAMCLFALVGAITPGPVNVLALRHGARAPRTTALLYVLGASASYAAVVCLMGRSARLLLQELPWLSTAAQWLGAAYLLWLAWRLARAPATATDTGGQSQARWLQAFVQGAGVQALNPKAWLVALAGVGLFVLPQAEAGQALLRFCAVSLLACLIGVGAWALLGQWLARWLRTPGRQQAFQRLLALLLAFSVAGMLA